jgi:hypothetical protein
MVKGMGAASVRMPGLHPCEVLTNYQSKAKLLTPVGPAFFTCKLGAIFKKVAPNPHE